MKLKKYDAINVIPFIDVLLVLLAIVLMTSTFITKGIIPISLPKASNSENLKKPNKEIVLVIQENGEIFYENKIESLESIEKIILQSSIDTPIHINTDKNTKFESFVQVLNILKKDNYTNISIVTKK